MWEAAADMEKNDRRGYVVYMRIRLSSAGDGAQGAEEWTAMKAIALNAD
jgi:hypothetical protein